MKKIFAVLAAAAVMIISAIPALALIPEEYASQNLYAPERLKPRVVDDADILPGFAEDKLLSRLDSISEEHNIDVVLVTVNSLGGRAPDKFARDYFAYNGFGMGDGKDGFVFMLAMDTRDYSIQCTGKGEEIFNDYGTGFLVDQMYGDLHDGDYYDAFDKYADISEDFIKEWEKGTPYSATHRAKGKLHPGWILGALIGGAVIGLIVSESIKAQLTSVSMQHGADDYIRKNSFKLTVQRDNFLYKNVTKTRIESSSGSSGGSHGHVSHGSSGGHSFSGRSGKF
ncbi:TPM domain-containing protein [Ruminococcus albus]|uniref:TPM domain-containing protein n=1 Tax=Ruminococcus albus TaxID=1264 RepID=A0A1I1EJT2_RUMAL|nr:TPM domain-containing protein [Ruminococcus albus]SFB86882.1 uncharacterized protein SAMN02910406_00705 [Ruminococcus albus]